MQNNLKYMKNILNPFENFDTRPGLLNLKKNRARAHSTHINLHLFIF